MQLNPIVNSKSKVTTPSDSDDCVTVCTIETSTASTVKKPKNKKQKNPSNTVQCDKNNRNYYWEKVIYGLLR